MSVRSRFMSVALIGSGIALGACMRSAPADQDPAPSASSSVAEARRPAGDDGARRIAVVPASDDLLARSSTGGPTIRRVLAAAKPTIGTPYKWGGTDLNGGIDCSNFTWLLYRSIGVPYDRYIRTQDLATMRGNAALSQVSFGDAAPGDLLVYGYRDGAGAWHGHVVILVDKTGRSTGWRGLVLGAHGSPVSAVRFVTFEGFDEGYFKTPAMRLVNVLRPVEPPEAR